MLDFYITGTTNLKISIKVLPASCGDSILLNFDNKNILIDGGPALTYYKHLKKEIKAIKKAGEVIDLLIITHIDCDHINGIIKLFKSKELSDNFIKEVWFNSGYIISKEITGNQDNTKGIEISKTDDPRTGFTQGIMLENILLGGKCWSQMLIYAGQVRFLNNDKNSAKLTILSPNYETLKELNDDWQIEKIKQDSRTATLCPDYDNSLEDLFTKIEENLFIEDYKLPNKSSIAFLFEYDNKKLLFAGDAFPSVIAASLAKKYSKQNKLKLDHVKLSHHGSKGNTNNELLDLIETENFIISTNGNIHNHPDKECLARIILHNKQYGRNTNLFFNYDCGDAIFKQEDNLDKNNVTITHLKEENYIITL